MVRVLLFTIFAMLAFAANSVLCRMALTQTTIDPASFTLVRIASGAVGLYLISAVNGNGRRVGGSWRGALALLAYAAAFSFAYVSLPAGTGALLLFGAVQATMVVAGLIRGEHLVFSQWCGLALALTGLAVLVAPGVSAPEPLGAMLMLAAGMAWGWYSLLGRSSKEPIVTTAGNFLRAVPLALAVFVVVGRINLDPAGLVLAALSGALASGVGYAVWYAVLPALTAARAASVQLSVPVITAMGAVMMLGEVVTLRLVVASIAVLGGIALVIVARARRI